MWFFFFLRKHQKLLFDLMTWIYFFQTTAGGGALIRRGHVLLEEIRYMCIQSMTGEQYITISFKCWNEKQKSSLCKFNWSFWSWFQALAHVALVHHGVKMIWSWYDVGFPCSHLIKLLWSRQIIWKGNVQSNSTSRLIICVHWLSRYAFQGIYLTFSQ